MRFEKLLKQLESTLSPSLIRMGLVRLQVDDNTLHLRKFPGETRFYLYGKITAPPPDFKSALEANLFGQQTGEAYFAYHPPTDSLVLMATFDEETITPELFSSRLQAFVNFYIHWKTETTKPRREGEESLLELMSKKDKRLFFI